MNLGALVLRELLHRKASAAIAASAVAAAVASVLVFVLFARASADETRMIQRDMGLNLLILPAATDLGRYWADGQTEHSIDEALVARLSDQKVANRLVPLVTRRVEWRGVDVMLTGIAAEIFASGARRKPVFGIEPEPGTLVVGAAIASALQLAEGAAVELLGEPFTVARVLGPSGSADDARVYARLADAQRLLGLAGRISEIQALECHCEAAGRDPFEVLRAELEPLLPGTQLVRRAPLAEARRRQRILTERTLSLATPALVALCALWLATLALLNVRARRQELGVLRALGYGARAVGAVVLGRALGVGFVGALLGVALAGLIARAVGASIFDRARAALDAPLVLAALLAAPLFAALVSLVPAALAATEDPARTLREE